MVRYYNNVSMKNAIAIFNCIRRDLQLSNEMGLAFLTHFSQQRLRLFKMSLTQERAYGHCTRTPNIIN